ncbi:MAG: hypothetical protein HKN44_02120 [Ilumatobacter sp.]|nr:hypothetical protein [Ilumatobacter sp.]
MPDSRPPIFDDGGDLPDVDRSRRDDSRLIDEPVDRYGDLRHPNFLVRRAIVVGVAVAAIAGGAVVVSNFIGEDGDESGAAFTSSDWNTIVSIDDITGSIVLVDDAGEETERFRMGVQPLNESLLLGDTVFGGTDNEIAYVSLRDIETVSTIDLASSTALLMPSGSAQTLMAASPGAGRAVFVNASSDEVIDTAALDEIVGSRYDIQLARSDPSGRHVLVTDSGNFQSVLFSFDRDTPSFFPGLALAVSDSLVVTAQNVGTDATVNVFNHDGEPGVVARTKSVRAGMVVSGGVVLVTVDGGVVMLSLDDGSVSEVSQLTIGAVLEGHVAVRGDRLIVIGEAGTAVIDDAGAVLADLPDAVPTMTGIDVVAPRRNDCLIVSREAVGEIAVIDLADGTILAEALANPEVLAGTDGCRVLVPTTSGYLLVTREGVLRATVTGSVVAIAPDARHIVVDNANRLELLPVVTEDNVPVEDEPIDIGRSGRAVHFAEL